LTQQLPVPVPVTLVTGRPELPVLVHITEQRIPPHSQAIVGHHPGDHQELCYIIQGSLAVTLGERTFMLHAGEAFFAHAHMYHACWNPTAQATTIVQIILPHGSIDGGVVPVTDTS
jgi:quercetin dioxygenase-like cupin family protein